MANAGQNSSRSWNIEPSSSGMFPINGFEEGMRYLEGTDWSEIWKTVIIQDDDDGNDGEIQDEVEEDEEEDEKREEVQSRTMIILNDDDDDGDDHDHVDDELGYNDERWTLRNPDLIQRAQSERHVTHSIGHQPTRTRWSVIPQQYDKRREENYRPTRTRWSVIQQQYGRIREENCRLTRARSSVVSQQYDERFEKAHRPTRNRWSVIPQQYGENTRTKHRPVRRLSSLTPQLYDESTGTNCGANHRQTQTLSSVVPQQHNEGTGTNYGTNYNLAQTCSSVITQPYDESAGKDSRPTRTLSLVVSQQYDERGRRIHRSLSLHRSAGGRLTETNRQSYEGRETRGRRTSSHKTGALNGNNDDNLQRRQSSTDICQICFSENVRVLRRFCCSFPICQSCFGKYLTTQIDDGRIRITCPNYGCRAAVPSEEISQAVDPDRRMKLERHATKSLRKKGFKACPQCNAITVASETLLSKARQEKSTFKVTCPVCELEWCYDCQTPWHKKSTCEKVRSNDKLFKEWTKQYSGSEKNARRCPKCQVYIQKSSGCDTMTCRSCSTKFCYRCGRRIGSHTHHCHDFLPHISSDPGTIFLIVLLAPLAIPAIVAVAAVSLPILIGYGGYKLIKAVRRRPTHRTHLGARQ